MLFHNCAHKTDPNGDWLSNVARLAPHHLHTVVTSDKATGWRAQLAHHNAVSNNGDGGDEAASAVDELLGVDSADGDNSQMETNSPWYIATEDETPKAIANKLGVPCKQLVLVNKDRYPGLTAASRLMARTKLLVPQVHNEGIPADADTAGAVPDVGKASDNFDLSKLGLGIWGKAASTTDGKQSGRVKQENQRRREHTTERRILNKKVRANVFPLAPFCCALAPFVLDTCLTLALL